MNTLAPTTTAAATLDARVENAGGLCALSYLGYAYLYFYYPLTGGP
jgi:hypothetical protein